MIYPQLACRRAADGLDTVANFMNVYIVTSLLFLVDLDDRDVNP